MSEPSIQNLIEKDGELYFTLVNVNVSLANAIRRVILSDIPCIVFNLLNDTGELINFEINTTRLNNEIIKQRLSAIPIHLKDIDIDLDDYLIEVNVKNETQATTYITTKDFKVKNVKTDKYLPESVTQKIFPPDPITGEWIDLCRLRPKISENLQGESLKFSSKISISTASKNGAFNVASTCCYGNTLDVLKIEQEREQFTGNLESKNLDDEDKIIMINDWNNLNSKRYFIPDSFDFIIESVGVLSNNEIVFKSLNILVERLENIREIYSKSTTLISNSNQTIENCFDIKLENEDFTIGKIIEYQIYQNHYNGDKILNFCGFRKPHPHINESFIRVAFKVETEITKVNELIIEACEKSIKIYQKLMINFNTVGQSNVPIQPIQTSLPITSQIVPDAQPKRKSSLKIKSKV